MSDSFLRRAVRRDAGLEQPGHVRMLEPRHDVALGEKAPQRRTAGIRPFAQHLERHRRVGGRIVALGEVDDAHASAPELLQDAEGTDASGQRGGHGRGRDGPRLVGLRQQGSGEIDGSSGKHAVRARVGPQEALHQRAERTVALAGARDEGGLLDGREIERRVEDGVGLTEQAGVGFGHADRRSVQQVGIQVGVQPAARLGPVALDRARADAQGLRGLVLGEPAEEAALDHPGLARVHVRKPHQRGVEGHEQVGALVGGEQVHRFQRDAPGARPALHRAAPAGVVDEDASHRRGRDGEEMGPVLEARLALVDEPQVGLVDQRRGAERVAGRFPPELAVRQAAQLLIDDGEDGVECHRVPVACPLQQRRHVLRNVHAGWLDSGRIFALWVRATNAVSVELRPRHG